MALDKRLAEACLYDAYNTTDHAALLVRNARSDLEFNRVADAIASLTQALKPAASSVARIEWALEQLRALLAVSQ